MRWSEYINESELRKAIAILKPNNQLFEVRIFGGSKNVIISGYFTDVETLIKAFDTVDVRGRNIYITLNAINPACYSREQHDKFKQVKQTTSDSEITDYQWLFVDLDPVRPTGISSTDEELGHARHLSYKVHDYLEGLGFKEPVQALSGNGYHLLYRVNLKNTEENTQIIDRCLKTLAMLFDNEHVKIDTSNFNPSRICKLHGTLAQKGADTTDRPHRMSRILSGDQLPEVNDKDVLLRLASELPEEHKPAPRMQPVSQQFDLLDFMREHGLTYKEDSNGGRDGSKIYRLDECPFDHSHRDGDAKIFQYSDGRIAFKCHHNSCRKYRWQDVREKFEPGAYDRTDDEAIDEGYRQHLKKVQEETPAPIQKPEKPKKKKLRKLKTAEALMEKEIPELKTFVGVGDELPFLVEGTCILSAKPKLGKSWLALALCLAVSKGEDFLGYKTQQCSALYLDLETSEVIQKKRLKKILHGEPVPKKFYLETETDNLQNGFIEQIEEYLREDPDIGVVVVDVFQIIRSAAKSIKESEYEHAYRDITPLNELAQKYHISIILVCHDRKAVDPDDPFSNILGSTGLQGAATQMIVMFRKRKDDPIHISVKGKTIDGLPELDVMIKDAQWSVVDGATTYEREMAAADQEYMESPIRDAVLAIAQYSSPWKGRCSDIKQDAIIYGVGLVDEPKYIGGFLHKHQGRFLNEDGVRVTIVNNGSGAKTYRIERMPLFTVDDTDEMEELPLMTVDSVD